MTDSMFKKNSYEKKKSQSGGPSQNNSLYSYAMNLQVKQSLVASHVEVDRVSLGTSGKTSWETGGKAAVVGVDHTDWCHKLAPQSGVQ